MPGKFVHDDVLAAAAAHIANNGNRMTLCNADPAGNYTAANTTYCLADHTLTTGSGNGDFTVEDGTTSGKKCTVEQQTGVVIDTSGTVTHVAILDTVNSKVLAHTTQNATAVTAANTVTIAEFAFEFRDAA